MLTRPRLSIFSLSALLLAAHPASAQTYHAGAGLTLTGTTFSVANSGVTGVMIGLPLSLTASSSSPILTVTNTGSGYGIKTVSSSGTGTYGTNTKYGNVGTLGDINGFGVYGSTAAGPYPYGVFGIDRASGNGDYGILGGVEPVSGSKHPAGVFGSDTSSSSYGYAVYGDSTSANGRGVVGNSHNSTGVQGLSSSSGTDGGGSGDGVVGISGSGFGIYGVSSSGLGAFGESTSGVGVEGSSASNSGVSGSSNSGSGVYGTNSSSGDYGILGGVEPVSGNKNPVGVFGSDTSAHGGNGVYGSSTSGSGVYGTNQTSGDTGFLGSTDPIYSKPAGVVGVDSSDSGNGVVGSSSGLHGAGVAGIATGDSGLGIYGVASGNSADGVAGTASGDSGIAILGQFISSNGVTGFAGYFSGNVTVSGTLTAGAKDFKIDHPLDPEHKYLTHASIESDKMENIYDGSVTTDGNGNATVTLPAWFDALNTDCHYQLTCIGQFAQAIVASKVKDNRFTIKTDKPNVEVSWQVTGARHDAFALAHPMQVEQDKPEKEQGLYQNPEAFGLPESMGIGSRHGQKSLRPAGGG